VKVYGMARSKNCQVLLLTYDSLINIIDKHSQ